MIPSDADDEEIRLRVFFFRSANGGEPVREWLKELPFAEKKSIGADVKTVQFGWPLGMPLVRKISPGLWEIRSTLQNRIARIFFTVEDHRMILLHGFIKKSQKTPGEDLSLALDRLAQVRGEK
ncbi:MAG: type II toxin-antitoxin system RelE/ParE family toxin [Anaerolineales bacterium]